jgi:FkbM family methyltransferase
VALWQVEDHTFFTQRLNENSVVVDLGANHGAFAHALIERFGCRVYAIEANADLCAEIKPHRQLQVLNLAIGGTAGMQQFFVASNDQSSTMLGAIGGAPVKVTEVQTTRLDALLDELSLSTIDLLKVDVEGAEVAMFDSCRDEFLQRCVQITVEFHDFNQLLPADVVNRVVERISGAGFAVLPMWMRSHGDTLFVNLEAAGVSRAQWRWARHAVRNWWWFRRFVKRKIGRSN